jgi:tetratricopeptide (TPR) repeat protein
MRPQQTESKPRVWAEAKPKQQSAISGSQAAPTPGNSAEAEAWKQVENAPTAADQAKLAAEFIEQYPQSDLVPNAHYFIAQSDFQAGNTASFIDHAEKAVAKLPGVADLLSQLAFVYAEGKQPDLAIERANQALERIDAMERPDPQVAASWVAQVYHVRGEAYYALGRAYLSKLGSGSGSTPDPNLSRAVNYLQAALRNNPRHDYAALRLAFAQRNMGHVGPMLLAYGRAVAIQGVASDPARQQLQEVLDLIKSKMPDSEWASKSLDDIVAEAGTQLEQEMTTLRQQQEREIQAAQGVATTNAPATSAAAPNPGR